jgi:hypothetical protein
MFDEPSVLRMSLKINFEFAETEKGIQCWMRKTELCFALRN